MITSSIRGNLRIFQLFNPSSQLLYHVLLLLKSFNQHRHQPEFASTHHVSEKTFRRDRFEKFANRENACVGGGNMVTWQFDGAAHSIFSNKGPRYMSTSNNGESLSNSIHEAVVTALLVWSNKVQSVWCHATISTCVEQDLIVFFFCP